MRGGSLGGGLRLAALAAASLGVAASSAARGVGGFNLALAGLKPSRDHHKGRTRYFGGYGRRGYFDPKINRHTGAPHEHAGEIARRQRQAERVAANRAARALRAERARGEYRQPATPLESGVSRRGRKVAL